MKDRIVDPEFWGKTAVKVTASAVMSIVNPVRYAHNHSDPTGLHIRVLSPKKEAKLFKDVTAFHFHDWTPFDFRGTEAQTADG